MLALVRNWNKRLRKPSNMIALALVIALTLNLPLPAAATSDADAMWKTGKIAYEKGDFESAIAKYRQAAKLGHTEAQYDFAMMLLRNEGPATEVFMIAFRLLVEASNNGHAKATGLLGQLYWTKGKVGQNREKALAYFKRAAELGDRDSEVALLAIQIKERSSRGGKDSTVTRLQQIAEEDHADALYVLGIVYLTGNGVEKNEKTAFTYFLRAAKLGHARAQYNLGMMYQTATGVDGNLAEARRWYEQATALGYRPAVKP